MFEALGRPVQRLDLCRGGGGAGADLGHHRRHQLRPRRVPDARHVCRLLAVHPRSYRSHDVRAAGRHRAGLRRLHDLRAHHPAAAEGRPWPSSWPPSAWAWAAFIAFSPDRSLPDTLVSGSVSLAGVSLGRPQVVTGLVALLLVAVLFVLVYRTRGPRPAGGGGRPPGGGAGGHIARPRQCPGLDAGQRRGRRGGALLTTFFYVFPSVGTVFGLLAFVAVCMGGFGSLPARSSPAS